MSYIPQQRDLEILYQPKRNMYTRIDLLNRSFKTVGRIEGELTSDSYSINADSDIRKTYSLSLIVKDSSFEIGNDKKIWLDKYIKLYIGLYHLRSREIVWYPMGIFIFDKAGYCYSSLTKELSLSCIDRMAELTGSRNGIISGASLTIDEGTPIRDAIKKAVTQLGGIQKYYIEDIGKNVPYDLEFGIGITVYDVIKELRDLYIGWETFFDNEFFVYQPYPTCASDPIVLDADIVSSLLISENTSVDFTKVRNVVEVWGKCLDSDRITEDVSMSGGVYKATYPKLSELKDGETFGFKACADNLAGACFQINDYKSYPILIEGNKDIEADRIKNGCSYVLKFVSEGMYSYFYFYGQYQIGAVAKLVSSPPTDEQKAHDLIIEPSPNIVYIVNSDSPYCSDVVGEIRQVLSEGEYSNIYSEDLAMQRGEYEVWKATDLLDTLTLEMADIPWLEVNQKIEYRSNITGLTQQYIIKTKKGSSTEGIMTLECVKFQPLYYWTD